MATLVRMPEVLANASEAAIQTWLVSVGDRVEIDQPLAEVETDKAVVEYAAETAGTVLRLLVDEGRSVAVGEPIMVIGAAGEEVDDAEATETTGTGAPVGTGTAQETADVAAGQQESAPPEPETAPEDRPSPVAASPTDLLDDGRSSGTDEPGAEARAPDAGEARRFASPLVRRLATQHGVPLSRLTGSGPGGRIVRRDLEAHLDEDASRSLRPQGGPGAGASAPPSGVPTPDYEEITPSTMRRTIARRLVESTTTAPHFFLVADIDVDPLLALRREFDASTTGARSSVNDWVVKGFAAAYQDVPDANVTWHDDVIRRYTSVDLAIAVSVPGGLLTPVLRSVQQQTIRSIGGRARELAEQAREGRLQPADLLGGTATVSNLGSFGVTEFSAILNPPQSAILAVGAARPQPVVRDGAIVAATVLTVTLSADHRVLDGVLAAQLLAAFVDRLSRPVSLLS